MPGKARVHELAKEFGVDSKTVLAKLKEQGEFVKSASSTVEAPVARRLREALGNETGGNGAAAPRWRSVRSGSTSSARLWRPRGAGPGRASTHERQPQQHRRTGNRPVRSRVRTSSDEQAVKSPR